MNKEPEGYYAGSFGFDGLAKNFDVSSNHKTLIDKKSITLESTRKISL